ncbi:hypothetical protein ACHQM5_012406 [Ranunculus cassubicifolius]
MAEEPPLTTFLRSRREPFEYGLLPIPKLIFSDGITTLQPLITNLIQRSKSLRVDAQSISEILQISIDNAYLVIDTIASVLPSDSLDPIVNANPEEIEGIDVNVYDLGLFLYVQSYKRLVTRGHHKDSPSVADVWPSTSAFDGCLSALSPLQLVRTNSRKFMPTQVDEEAHQLSYLHKHLDNIISLLVTPGEGEGEESLVLKSETFDRLGLLMQFGDKGSEKIPMSQAAPFFANSDPNMPAVHVSAAQVLDWLSDSITTALEKNAERGSSKENSLSNATDQDVAMADVSTSSGLSEARKLSFLEGISKSSVVKKSADIGSSVKILNCHDSVIYVLAPLNYATIYGCSDATVVLGAIGKVLRVEHCERVHVVTASKRICIANCRECTFYLGVNQRPLILGDNHKLQVAPYNTYYPELEEHMTQVGITASINKWNDPMVLGVGDPHDALSHPAGISEVQPESAACLDPDQFTNFLIPNWSGGKSSPESTKHNPFPLPAAYMASQQKNNKSLDEIKQALRDLALDENRKKEISSALHVCFKDWLYSSGNVRQLYCGQGE